MQNLKLNLQYSNMKQYIKNGNIATNQIFINGMQIINPSHEQLIQAGYKLVDKFDEENYYNYGSLTNEQIEVEREKQYKLRSDSYFIASQKYLALGDLKKSEEFKTLWLKEIEAINNEYPYGTD